MDPPHSVESEWGTVNLFDITVDRNGRAWRFECTIIHEYADGHKRDSTHSFEHIPKSDSGLENIANYQIITAAYEKSRFGFGNESVSMVYDNQAALYLSKPLRHNREVFIVELDPFEFGEAALYVQAIKVFVILKQNSIVNYNDKVYYAPAAVAGQEVRELKRFLELLTTQPLIDSGNYTVNKSGYAHYLRNSGTLLYGLELLRGVVKGVHVYETKNERPALRLNVDVNYAPFYPVINVAQAFFHFKSHGSYDIELFLAIYKHVKFTLSYRKTKTYYIDNVAELSADELTFHMNDHHTTVAEYYRIEHGITLKYPELPPLKLRSKTPDGVEHFLYFPMEVCEILAGQRVTRRKYSIIAPDFEAFLLQSNSLIPYDRAFMIQESLRDILEPPDYVDDILAAFGIQLSSSRTKIEISHLKLPKLGPNLSFMRGVEFKVGTYAERVNVTDWILLVDTRSVNPDIVRLFLRRLNHSSTRVGVTVHPPHIVDFNSTRATPDDWYKLFNDFRAENRQLIFLLDSLKVKSHGMLKICEQRFQVLTQHAVIESLEKMKCLDNVFHKMHIKLNGLNYKVDPEPCASAFSLESDEFFFIGYDVSHPPAIQNEGEFINPSVVGVASNSAASPYNFIGDYFYQTSRQESVDGPMLRKLVLDALIQRRRNRPHAPLPKVVFIVRDGLAEGQFEMVRREELPALQAACTDFNPDWHPKFVVIIATKRHNKRFFVDDCNNVKPTSVMNFGVARAFTNEFYLMSSQPSKGTAKPPDYVILMDGAKLGTVKLQAIVHMLCYNHQIINLPIGLPVPVIQAHELAKRGANNLAQFLRLHMVPELPNGGTDIMRLNELLRYTGRELQDQRFNA